MYFVFLSSKELAEYSLYTQRVILRLPNDHELELKRDLERVICWRREEIASQKPSQ